MLLWWVLLLLWWVLLLLWWVVLLWRVVLLLRTNNYLRCCKRDASSARNA